MASCRALYARVQESKGCNHWSGEPILPRTTDEKLLTFSRDVIEGLGAIKQMYRNRVLSL
jgi:hypothetical protein